MMQRFRKFGALRAPLKAATGFKKPASLARFSTWTTDSCPIIHEEPRNDGFKYFESEAEKARNKLMEENFEKVLNQYRTSEAKQTLVLLLDPIAHEKRSWLERHSFYDWRFALPTIAYIVMPLFAQEFIPFNLMMNLDILFLYNTWLWYSFLAHRIGPDLDSGIHDILLEVQSHDTKVLNRMTERVVENERLIAWGSEVNEVLEIADELTTAQVDVFNSMEGHAFRNGVASKLDALVSLEMAANQNIRHRMVTAVKSEVKTLFTTNKTARENAMNQAIAILTAGPSAKMGKDVVGDAFCVAVKNYQEQYSKLPAGSDEIFSNLEKDMAAVMTPVEFEVTGGNVFETNLIRM